jgi:hypothetical protein
MTTTRIQTILKRYIEKCAKATEHFIIKDIYFVLSLLLKTKAHDYCTERIDLAPSVRI